MVAGIKKFSGLDFVPTISDSEDDVPVLDSSDDEKVEVKKTAKKAKSKKNKKKAANADGLDEDVHEDLNAGFKFDLEADDTTSNFQGWNFMGEANEDDPEAPIKKDVDLDKIIRRKGGLVKMAHIDTKEEEEEEKEEEAHDSDDEELAMDGFGMGAPTKNEDEDDSEDEPEEEEEEQEEEQEELTLEKGGKNDEVVEEDDSEEAKADFYAPETEANDAKKQMYDNFNSLSLSRPVLKGLASLGYVKPSPIQSATIPIALLGKDIIAGAVTGSGKTAAFMIPIIERLLYKPARLPPPGSLFCCPLVN